MTEEKSRPNEESIEEFLEAFKMASERKRLGLLNGLEERAQDLLGEDAFPSLFHREGILLGGRGLSNLARRLLGRLDLLPMIFFQLLF